MGEIKVSVGFGVRPRVGPVARIDWEIVGGILKQCQPPPQPVLLLSGCQETESWGECGW